MEKSYTRLLRLVNTGKLETLYILSPPRTFSTAFQVALTEWGDGNIFEPFNRRCSSSFDDACNQILDRVEMLKKKSSRNPVRLVVKDVTKYVNVEKWKKLSKLSSRVLFTIREPTSQLYSLIKRRANDLYEYNSDTLSQDQIVNFIPKIKKGLILDRTWRQLKALIDNTNKPFAIVSGITYRASPRLFSRLLVKELDLGINAESVNGGWCKGCSSNFYCTSMQSEDNACSSNLNGAWLGKAVYSKSFLPLSFDIDSPHLTSVYPGYIQEYFFNEVLPNYLYCMSHSRNITKLPKSQVGHKLLKSVGKYNPIESYVHCKINPNLAKYQSSYRETICNFDTLDTAGAIDKYF